MGGYSDYRKKQEMLQTCNFFVQPPPMQRTPLQPPGMLMLTVCLTVSVCVCFKVPRVAGDLRDGLWLCQGSCLRQSCCTDSKLGLWESPGKSDTIKMQF